MGMMAESQENPAAIAAITAAYLQQGRALDMLSRGITLIACIAVFTGVYTGAPLPLTLLAILVVLFGLAEAYFALRVGFDAALFGHLAREAFGIVSFDISMRRLNLMPDDRTGRPMTPRATGAMVLFRRQATALLLQVLAIFALPLVALLW
jgi:hypothetical protein